NRAQWLSPPGLAAAAARAARRAGPNSYIVNHKGRHLTESDSPGSGQDQSFTTIHNALVAPHLKPFGSRNPEAKVRQRRMVLDFADRRGRLSSAWRPCAVTLLFDPTYSREPSRLASVHREVRPRGAEGCIV